MCVSFPGRRIPRIRKNCKQVLPTSVWYWTATKGLNPQCPLLFYVFHQCLKNIEKAQPAQGLGALDKVTSGTLGFFASCSNKMQRSTTSLDAMFVNIVNCRETLSSCCQTWLAVAKQSAVTNLSSTLSFSTSAKGEWGEISKVSRCLCHCLCLRICVFLWFFNSFHHKLSEYVWL